MGFVEGIGIAALPVWAAFQLMLGKDLQSCFINISNRPEMDTASSRPVTRYELRPYIDITRGRHLRNNHQLLAANPRSFTDRASQDNSRQQDACRRLQHDRGGGTITAWSLSEVSSSTGRVVPFPDTLRSVHYVNEIAICDKLCSISARCLVVIFSKTQSSLRDKAATSRR